MHLWSYKITINLLIHILEIKKTPESKCMSNISMPLLTLPASKPRLQKIKVHEISCRGSSQVTWRTSAIFSARMEPASSVTSHNPLIVVRTKLSDERTSDGVSLSARARMYKEVSYSNRAAVSGTSFGGSLWFCRWCRVLEMVFGALSLSVKREIRMDKTLT